MNSYNSMKNSENLKKLNKKIVSRYGKNFEDILDIKNDYFKKNKEFLDVDKEQSISYKQQEKRINCKICDNKLEEKLFEKLNIGYFSCSICGHLNGEYEDSDEFVNNLYVNEGGAEYSKIYHTEDNDAYQNRVEKIYIPKANFLLGTLDSLGEKSNNLNYVDFGAGSGYFVAAMNQLGVNSISGYDPSEVQVTFGNKMNQFNELKISKAGNEIKLLESISSDVISMIGVLEHLQNPIGALSAIVKNPNIRYIYISVPMFSLTVFFEVIFKTIHNRHLAGAHTHLFTEKSLEFIFKKFNLEKVGEWWFGTDIMDLYRSMSVLLDEEKISKYAKQIFKEMIHPIMNSTQLEMDKKLLSSEVHLLLKKL